MRKRLATFGNRGKLVRLFLDVSWSCETCGRASGQKDFRERHAEVCDKKPLEAKRYIVQWGPKAAREQDSYPGTPTGKAEAEAFFKAFEDELTQTAAPTKEPLTMRQLWEQYTTAEFGTLRPNTQRLYTDAWTTWEEFVTPAAIAEELAITTINDFRKALDDRGLATATVQDCIRNVRIVFNWGERMELINRNRWHLFIHKVAKEKRTKAREEYSAEEFLKIWSAVDPEDRWQWRAWVAVGLLGIYGNRASEILQLRWSWITNERITVDAKVVKTGEEAVLHLFPLARQILAIARRWAVQEAYRGEYVLFSGQSRNQRAAARANVSKVAHYTVQSLTNAIHRAERRSGVPVIKWRAAHGFRRGLVGDLADETGDVMLALQAIRDRDIRMAPRYRTRRAGKIDKLVQGRAERLLGGISIPEGATEVQRQAGNSESALEDASLTHSVEDT